MYTEDGFRYITLNITFNGGTADDINKFDDAVTALSNIIDAHML